MNSHFILLLLVVVSSLSTPGSFQTSEQVPLSPRMIVGGRAALGAPVIYQMSELVRLNSTLRLPALNSNDTVYYWLLYRYTTQSFQQSLLNQTQSLQQALSLYAALPPRPQNSSLAQQYPCSTPEGYSDQCAQMTIQSVGFNDLGLYVRNSISNDMLSSTMLQYNVSAYQLPIQFQCNGNTGGTAACAYNNTTNTLSVLYNQPYQLSCAILIAQNDLFPITAQFNFYLNSGLQDCSAYNSTVTPLGLNGANLFAGISSANYNVLATQLSKSCVRVFGKSDQHYACSLVSAVNDYTTPGRPAATNVYETLNVTVNVQYGPDYVMFSQLNYSSYVGAQVTLQCPFQGNPISYYWRQVSTPNNVTLNTNVPFLLANQSYTVYPTFPSTGVYVYQCYAYVGGLVNVSSSSVQMLVYVGNPPAPNQNKAANMRNPAYATDSLSTQNSNVNIGALVGGIIGGLILLIIIIVIVVLIVRCQRNRKNPDEGMEKAKELDIDINDHGLNPRNHMSQLNPTSAKLANGVGGQKMIAGLMVQSSTAQSYAAIAHAAAAAAAQQHQRVAQANNGTGYISGSSSHHNLIPNGGLQQVNGGGPVENMHISGSAHNIFNSNNTNNNSSNGSSMANFKSHSYNNPGFFESSTTPFSIPNLESPPPYDDATTTTTKKTNDSSPNHVVQQQHLQQRSNQFLQQPLTPSNVNSNANRLMTPTVAVASSAGKPPISTSHSYTPTHHNNLFNNTNMLLANQQHQQQQAAASTSTPSINSPLQYANVHNIEQRSARNRNPMSGDTIDGSQQQPEYSSVLTTNPISSPVDV